MRFYAAQTRSANPQARREAIDRLGDGPPADLPAAQAALRTVGPGVDRLRATVSLALLGERIEQQRILSWLCAADAPLAVPTLRVLPHRDPRLEFARPALQRLYDAPLVPPTVRDRAATLLSGLDQARPRKPSP